jgi:L-alanine-DL-glutamate epimerase-like enolase superfamily enzyme
MKVEAVRLLGERLPMTLVEVIADDGTIGIGGADAPSQILRPLIEQEPWNLARMICGRDPTDHLHIADEMFRATLGQSGLIVYAQAALDMALWDLNAKLVGRPLHELFGAAVQNRIMPYASATAFDLTGGLVPPLRFKTTERLVSEASERVREGFRAIKFGWGNHFEPKDIERISAIRAAIGPEVRLMLDFGGPDYFDAGVSSESAMRITHLLEPYDIFFFEEPLAPYDADGFLELKRSSRIRIATGEMLCREWEFDRFLTTRAVDVIQPDAYRIGITATLAIARRTETAGILCIPHSPWSALAIAAHVHILSTVATGVMVEFPSPSLYTDTVRHGELIQLANGRMVDTPFQPQDGYLNLPDRPGLGLGQFRSEAIKRMESLTRKGLER